eukprot:403345616
MVLFYAVTRFKSVFDRAEYDLIEEYKPLSVNSQELTFDTFIDTSELVIQFIRPWDTVYQNCSQVYTDNVTLVSANPDAQLQFTLTDDFTEVYSAKCNLTINQKQKFHTDELQKNFTIFFSCPQCATEYQVAMTQYFVNSEGLYSHEYVTQENRQFRQKSVQLIPIIIRITESITQFTDDYVQAIKISSLTTISNQNDTDSDPSVTIFFGDSEILITETPRSIWSALKDVGGMLSLLFLFAIFANCSHSNQFHKSLQRFYFKRQAKQKRLRLGSYEQDTVQSKKKNGQGDNQFNLSSDEEQKDNQNKSEDSDEYVELEMQDMTARSRKRREKNQNKEFMQFLSFENYIDLNKRVQYMENALEQKGLLSKNPNRRSNQAKYSNDNLNQISLDGESQNPIGLRRQETNNFSQALLNQTDQT